MAQPPGNLNVYAADKPVYESNQVVSAPGKNYYYDEELVLIDFYPTATPTNIIPIQVLFTKVGRLVTMHVPHIRMGGALGASFIQTNSEQIPKRFRPCVNNSATAPYDEFRYTVGTRQEPVGENIGTAKIRANGTIEYFYDPAGGNFPATTSAFESFNVYCHAISWLAPSSYGSKYELPL